MTLLTVVKEPPTLKVDVATLRGKGVTLNNQVQFSFVDRNR